MRLLLVMSLEINTLKSLNRSANAAFRSSDDIFTPPLPV